MAKAFEKKAIFIWQIDAIEGGDAGRIAQKLVAANFEAAYLHVTDVSFLKGAITPQLVATLKAAGLSVIGSSAIYGFVPDQEGRLAGQACLDLDLDGFIFDAEGQFESQPQANSNAVKVLINFRAVAKNLPVGWCYFPLLHEPANPNHRYHDTDIVRAVMETKSSFRGADYAMPMVYWNPGTQAADAVNYLNNSFNIWREFTSKPIVPIGRAYQGDSGKATPEAILAFDAQARKLGCPGISWWSMFHAVNQVTLPGVWDALTATPKFAAADAAGHLESEAVKDTDPNEVLRALIAWAKTQPQPYNGPELV